LLSLNRTTEKLGRHAKKQTRFKLRRGLWDNGEKMGRENKISIMKNRLAILISLIFFFFAPVAQALTYWEVVSGVSAGNQTGPKGQVLGASTSPDASRVLIIYNTNFTNDDDGDGVPDSQEVANYYAQKRGVPQDHILGLALDSPIILGFSTF